MLVGAALIGVVVARPSGSRPAAALGCQVGAVSGPGSFTITPGQAQNASIIAAVAMKDGLPDHAVTVALATALRESRLTNLTYGDRDSVGLFQQRPSQGWGTRAQILDPVYATTAFYGRLVQVPGWQTMAVTEAAQTVQRSATPTAYAAEEDEARALAAALTGEVPAGFSCRLSGFSGPRPASVALRSAATEEMGSQLVGASVDTTQGWRVASWAVAHAWAYHLQAVEFGAWKWTAATGRWVDGGPLAAGPPVVQVFYAK